jgi:hypothetical protein
MPHFNNSITTSQQRKKIKKPQINEAFLFRICFLVVWGGIEPPTQGFSVPENLV